MSKNFVVKHGLEVADGLEIKAGGLTIVAGSITLPNELRIGTAADAARFPNTVVSISNTTISTKPAELHNIGLLAEGTANSSDTTVYGVGVYGIGYTAGATRSGGVVGEGHVSDTTDTGSSIGVRGYALDTHAGGANIGLYGNAANGLTNYALYMTAGDINSVTSQTWTLGGDLTFSGTGTVTIPSLGLTNALPVTSGGTGVTTATGSGSVVLSNNAILVTPVLGDATATTINKVTLTQPATGSTITVADGKVLVVDNSLTFTGIDLSSIAFGTGGTVVYTTNKLSTLASTTSAELAGVISDETGSGLLVFNDEPTIANPNITSSITTTSAAFNLVNGIAENVQFAGDATVISIGSGLPGTTTINHNLQVAGNITFGSGTELSATVINVDDPLIYLATNNAADTFDIGFIGAYAPNVGDHIHTGFVRDATDKKWKLFSGILDEPVVETIDFTGAVYDGLKIGGLEASSGTFSASLSATQVTSTIATGTAPFVVTSTTPVANLSIGGNAATVTTNANLTGVITSVGNATSITSQTGTGTKFVMDTSPSLITPNVGDASATSINKVTITAPASNATLTLANGSTLETAGAHSITLSSTANTNVTLPVSGTLLTDAVTSLPDLVEVGNITTGTWTSLFGAVSGANLIDITAGNLIGTIPSTVLGNSSAYIGNTSIALNRAADSLSLTGVDIDGSAGGLKTTGDPVVVSASAAPSPNQVLTATSETTAEWKNPAASGVTSVSGTGTVNGLSLSGTVTSTGDLTLGGTLSVDLSTSTVTGTLPVAQGGTGVTASTGTGTKFVLDTSPELTTPNIGNATASSINKVVITEPTSNATLTLANGSSLITVGDSHTLSLTTTGNTSVTLPVSGTLLTDSYSVNIGTSSVSLNRASATLNLSGVNIDGYAGALKTATGSVIIGSTEPTAGQVLTAIDGTSASWQNPTGGGGGGTVGDTTGSGTKLMLSVSPTITTSLLTDSTSFDLLNTTATSLNIGGAATAINMGAAGGTTTLGGNLVVTGTITHNGNVILVNTSSINVTQPLIFLANDNTTDSVDIGITGKYNDGSDKYTGFVRDASDSGTWKLFNGCTTAPTTTVDFANGSLVYASLKIGALSASTGTFSSTITATKFNKVTLTAPTTGATLTLADNSTVSTAGDFSTSGAYALTLTTTAATNVTLPTSGTLLSSASTTFNKVTITAPTTSATLTLADNSTLSTAGNFTTSGAYALTLTATAATNVTLPTTGTLLSSDSPTITTPTVTGLKETRVAIPANAIDLATGNYFTKTISTATTLTVSSVPSAGLVGSFILDLTNGGAGAITWWSGMKWVGGTPPTLTTAGRDSLGFYTYDGGATWTGLVLGKDIK